MFYKYAYLKKKEMHTHSEMFIKDVITLVTYNSIAFTMCECDYAKVISNMNSDCVHAGRLRQC